MIILLAVLIIFDSNLYIMRLYIWELFLLFFPSQSREFFTFLIFYIYFTLLCLFLSLAGFVLLLTSLLLSAALSLLSFVCPFPRVAVWWRFEASALSDVSFRVLEGSPRPQEYFDPEDKILYWYRNRLSQSLNCPGCWRCRGWLSGPW